MNRIYRAEISVGAWLSFSDSMHHLISVDLQIALLCETIRGMSPGQKV